MPSLILILVSRLYIRTKLVTKSGMTLKLFAMAKQYLHSLLELSSAQEVHICSHSMLFASKSSVLAPQKIMWMAWDRYRRTKRDENIKIDFYTGMPTMFSVKKYSDALETLRLERGVGAHFQNNLVAVDSANHRATFKKADGSLVDVDYTMLHVTPPMGPLDLFKGSPIADSNGWVDVDKSTLRHNNPEYGNIFALGDCSSLPTSKTAAAITAQAPVLTENLYSVMETGKVSDAVYDGYTSCPVRPFRSLRRIFH